jgi:hypothetical protein
MKYAALLLALISACTVTGGNVLDPADLQQIEVGVTTEQQVLDLLGEPMNVVFDGAGGKTMLYHQAIGKPGLLGPKVEHKSASIHVNSAGLVIAVDLPAQ